MNESRQMGVRRRKGKEARCPALGSGEEGCGPRGGPLLQVPGGVGSSPGFRHCEWTKPNRRLPEGPGGPSVPGRCHHEERLKTPVSGSSAGSPR